MHHMRDWITKITGHSTRHVFEPHLGVCCHSRHGFNSASHTAAALHQGALPQVGARRDMDAPHRQDVARLQRSRLQVGVRLQHSAIANLQMKTC